MSPFEPLSNLADFIRESATKEESKWVKAYIRSEKKICFVWNNIMMESVLDVTKLRSWFPLAILLFFLEISCAQQSKFINIVIIFLRIFTYFQNCTLSCWYIFPFSERELWNHHNWGIFLKFTFNFNTLEKINVNNKTLLKSGNI